MKKNITTKYIATTVIAGLAALALTACGSDSSSEESVSVVSPADSTYVVEQTSPAVQESAPTAVADSTPVVLVAEEQPMSAAPVTAQTAAPVATAAPTTVAAPVAAPNAPAFVDVRVDCLNRGLRVNVAVNGGSSSISRVIVKRANDEGAELETRMSAMGPDTGDGNEWTAVNVAGVVDRITVVATDSAGMSVSTVNTFDLPC